MQKLKIRLPATITNLGPGLRSLGLAVALYTTVEISERDDTAVHIEINGEGAEQFDVALHHPVMLAIIRFFQILERATLGINIRIDNQIPLNSGLGAETAFAVAGILGANSLLGGVYKRDEMLEIAAHISRADGVAAALMGGLTAAVLEDDDLLYRTLTVKTFSMIVVVPQLKSFASPILPEQVPRRDAMVQISRIPFLLEALRLGDLHLFVRMLDDALYSPRLTAQITGYEHVAETARRAGALMVTTCSDGPGLLAFAEGRHERVGEAMVAAFKSVGVFARYWVLPVDTQGVVISAVQSS